MSIEEQEQFDLRRTRELLDAEPSVEGIEATRIELAEDWTSDPILYLVYTLRKDLTADLPRGGRLQSVSMRLGLKILDNGVSRFPHVRLERAA